MYSQNNEEQLIANYFGDRVGTFLDLGSNDGITLSNTRALAEKGWSGVCVDASPRAFGRLEKLYAGQEHIECHWVAMYTRQTWITLHESGSHITNTDTALLSSVVQEETGRWRPTTEYYDVRVPAITFDMLLKRSKFKTFDFVSIDIEGMDLAVLQQMDLTALGCQMLVVEVNNNDPKPFIDHCHLHAMRLMTRNSENLLFIR